MGLCASAMCQQVSFVSGGIVYGITAEQTAEVMPYYTLLDDPYSGAVSIPQTVEHGGTTYTVTALAESAFEDCSNVTALTLPPTIRSIGAYCFYNCNFTSLQLPDSLRSLGDHAFLYSRVSSLHLPACFEEYSEAAFWARNLTDITVDDANPRYRSIGGWLYSKDSLTLCVVPDGATGTLNVPSYVRHIGPQAFGFNSRATSVALPEGITSIGDFAFNCCSRINNIVIPSTVTRIGLCPFSYCPQLSNLTVANGNTHYVMDGLLLYSSGYDTLVSCHKSGTSVTLNPNLKVLGGFENNTWVRNIDIPAGVTDISDNCFNGCQITSITLPTHMRSIGRKAFSENDRLTSVVMPQTLLVLGQGAFEKCFSLASIVIPDSLRIIPKEAFNSCIKLWSITWGDVVEEIGDYAFWAMGQMSSTHITSLDFPTTLRKVGEAAFGACDNNLRNVRFNGPVDTLGYGIFYQANIDCLAFSDAVPPAIVGDGPLATVGSIDSIVIPCGSLDTWLADSYWGQFADKYIQDCDGIGDIPGNGLTVRMHGLDLLIEGSGGETVRLLDITGRTLYNGTAPRLSLPSPGIYLLQVGERPARKIAAL